MCGRITVRFDACDVAAVFDVPEVPEHFARPRYNIKPTQQVAAIREQDGRRMIDPMRWGLIASWSKEFKTSYATWNAAAETVAVKPSYRAAYKARRCLIPVDGFYEWTKHATPKMRYFIHRPEDGIFALAGLWEAWGPESLLSCTIVTTTPTGATRPFHDRSPVILDEADWSTWMNAATPLDVVAELMRPAPDDRLIAYAANPQINMGEADDERCIAPMLS